MRPPTWIPLNEAAGLVFISTNSGKDFPEHPYQALKHFLATLADGGLWAEGIKAGQEPPDYVRLSEAWWAGALIVPPKLRTVEPIGRTVVDFRAAISRRRTSRDVVVEYRSIRLLAEEFLKVHPRPDLNKIMHTFPELCRWTSMLGVRRGGVLITFDKSKRPAEAIPIFEVGEPSPSPSIRELMAAFDGPNERQPVRTEFAGRPSARTLIAAEMKRRAKSGELKSSLRQEAIELATWYAEAHPEGPSTTDGTIRNSLGDLYKELKGRTTTPRD